MKALQLATPPAEPGPEERVRQGRRWLWWGLGLVAICAGVAFAVQKQKGDPLGQKELTEVKRTDIEEAVTALGKIQPRDYVDVGAQVSGQLKRLVVRVGDTVEQGALLAEIDPSLQLAELELHRAQLAQLQAERAVQKLQVEFTQSEFERQQRMKQDGTTRDDVFAQKRSDARMAVAKLDSIEAQIRQIESTLKADQAELGYTRIYAPMRGTIVSLDARVGQTLIAAQQAPVLLRIADLSSMTIWAQVSEADITRLHVGMDVYFTTLGHPGRKWRSKLQQLLPAPHKPASVTSAPAPASANSVVLYTALFDVDNQAGELRPEMSAQVFFVMAEAKDAVVMPVAALNAAETPPDEAAAADRREPAVPTPPPSSGTVQVASADGRLSARAVKLGVRNRFDVQVVEGLRAGERVVTGTKPEDEAEAVP